MSIDAGMTDRKAPLERLYAWYNRRAFAHPDPVELLYGYPDVRDREIAALVASSLAYGRVAQIVRSVAMVLDKMRSPAAFLAAASVGTLRRSFAGFRHRFTSGDDLANMLLGTKRVIARYGCLHSCFASLLEEGDEDVTPALGRFVEELRAAGGGNGKHLLPSPGKGSACKRLNLFLRWMVRKDEIDPGGWSGVPKSKLIVPLDTHMHRISVALRLTRRKQANLATALEVTAAFRSIAPEDPVRYDFALTRLGIRNDADFGEFVKLCNAQEAGHG